MKLYKLGSNNILEWEGFTLEHDEHTEIHIIHGVLNGKKQYEIIPIYEGKNIGKINATTHAEQAEAELQSRANKKINFEMYVDSIDKIYNNKKYLKPMKSFKYEERYIKDNWKYPYFMQFKYDGVRCVAYKKGFNIELKIGSGYTTTLAVKHINEELLKVMNEGDILDGELYCHGMDLKDTKGIVMRKKNIVDCKYIKFIIFDAPVIKWSNEKNTFNERYEELKRYFNNREFNYLEVAKTVLIKNKQEEEDFYKLAIENGYEGAIYRKINMLYEEKRSYSILKRKNFSDDEFLIVGVKPIQANNGALMVGSFICLKHDKTGTFDCSIKGTESYKIRLFCNENLWKYKLLNVRYLQIWDGVPQIPIGQYIRNKELL